MNNLVVINANKTKKLLQLSNQVKVSEWEKIDVSDDAGKFLQDKDSKLQHNNEKMFSEYEKFINVCFNENRIMLDVFLQYWNSYQKTIIDSTEIFAKMYQIQNQTFGYLMHREFNS